MKMRAHKIIPYLMLTAVVFSQACVGKFLSTMLSDEGKNFKLIEVTPVANTRIRVGFNKPLDFTKGATLTLSNYSIPGLNLVSVEKSSETHQVFLNLSATDSVRMQKISYTLTVSNVLNQTLDPLLSDGRSMTFTGTRWLRAICQNDDGTSSCPPISAVGGATTYTVKVRGDYAVGQNYRWQLMNLDTSTAVPGYDWSAITPVSQSFSITGLPTANLRLNMQVQDALGAWQPATDYSIYDFFVDSTPPANIGLNGVGGFSAVPAYTTTTNVQITNVSLRPRSCTEFPSPGAACSATPEAPSHYKYRVRYTAGLCPGAGGYGSWSAERSANQPINENFGTTEGCYNIQVIARDQAGNWQCNTALADGVGGACPGGPGTGSITDWFNNKPYQVANFQFDLTGPTAAFIAGTLPLPTTSATSMTVEVQSTSDVLYYQYRLTTNGVPGVWSGDKVTGVAGAANAFIVGNPPGESISFAGLSNGDTYIIDIIGKDLAGNYQSVGSPTGYTFTVNTSVPAATLTAYTGAGGCVGMQGLPQNPTNNNCFSVTVGGAGVTHYKATFVSGVVCPNTDGAYGAATAVATRFINLAPAFVNGTTYSLCVRGGAAVGGPFGLAAGEITRWSFTFDNAPPTGTAVTQLLTPAYSTAPATGTINTILTDADVIIGSTSGEAVLAYKGDIYTGACPAIGVINALVEKSVYTPLQKTGMAAGATRVCFIGRDAAGNYQTSVQSYLFTIFTPATPADGGGALDNAYVNNFSYTWAGIPTDVTEIRIKICTDAPCASPIPGFQNGVVVCSTAGTCAGTTSYNVVSNCTGLGCIKPLNGSNYYAQLRVTDASGNVSSFGTSSNGKIITGGITGIIRDTVGVPVSGATVTLRQYNAGSCAAGAAIGANVVTGAGGVFTFNSGSGHNVPISLSSNGYCVQASTVGPVRQGEKRFINVDPAADTNVGSIYVVDTTGAGCMIGSLVDGSTGSQLTLSNATFTLKDWNGATISGAPALDPDGKQFVFPASCVASTAAWGNAPYTSPLYNYGCLNPKNTNVPTCNNNARPTLDNSQADGAATTALSSGVYSLQAAVPNYYSFTEPSIGVTNAAAVHTGYLPMVGTFPAGSKSIKIIATWGTGAKDLDLHLVGPSSTGFDCQPDNEAAILQGAANKFHIYFQQKYCAEPGTFAPTGSAYLAVDDTFEYGPEIINIVDASVDGTYKISLFNNDTVAPNWTASKARIYIYAGNFYTGGGGLIRTVDTHASSTNRLWKPIYFTKTGSTISFTEVVGVYANNTYAQLVGTSDGLTAGAAPTGGSAPKDPNTDPGLFANGLNSGGGAGPADW